MGSVAAESTGERSGLPESLRRQVGQANGQTDGGREGKGVAAAPGEEAVALHRH